MDAEFIQDRIENCKLMIIAYEDAIFALTEQGLQSYTLNTSQSNQVVTKLNLATLQKALDSAYNRYAVLQARLGNNGIIAKPGW